ncbi:MAG: hypothetical protein ACR2P1_27250 [Pseudomonadales bacterium]
MFNRRRRAKSDNKSSYSSKSFAQAYDAQPITYEFVATFDTDAATNHRVSDDSGIYTMCPEDRFAVLRDVDESTTNEKTQASIATNRVNTTTTGMPKVIAVILEPNGQSRFFHPEESRRADRPIWRPLQRVES